MKGELSYSFGKSVLTLGGITHNFAVNMCIYSGLKV